jgi:thioredoxin reductase (NADPH)
VAVHGQHKLGPISIACAYSGSVDRMPANFLFLFIGGAHRTDWIEAFVVRDERGFILAGADLVRQGKRPNGWIIDRDPFLPDAGVPGVFAVGDVRHGCIKRVASSGGEGSNTIQLANAHSEEV